MFPADCSDFLKFRHNVFISLIAFITIDVSLTDTYKLIQLLCLSKTSSTLIYVTEVLHNILLYIDYPNGTGHATR
jgi:hypothetical protein